MNHDRHSLPPLNCLRAFEAAARHLSVTRAAEELHLTQSAISRQIKRLENDLGRLLFDRSATGVRLTPAGEGYFLVVQRVLRELSEATFELRRHQGEQQLTIASSPTIASLWLARQLPDFQRLHPEISIRILIVEDPYRLDLAEFDLGLYYHLAGEVDPPGMTAEPVFAQEMIAALCAPSYLAREGAIGDAMALLNQHVILMLEDHYHDWMTWPTWFDALGLAWQSARRPLYANSYQLLMNAALAGQGVTLGWTSLLDFELREGLLVKALPLELESPGRLSLFTPMHRHFNVPMHAFKCWLFQA
ncbi:LysR substrate-binding domain-containing protein [Phytohalomonas tamaricis]|uniref:LysR substrate-binding domain-containing protein n=1 Tax=Phytohalomonas tamaricis TaxID=2081032 RepID=UPI000D0B95FD|nr:LysR substrate-binding domain-containing protein [Phytohalomonas tamaricis]